MDYLKLVGEPDLKAFRDSVLEENQDWYMSQLSSFMAENPIKECESENQYELRALNHIFSLYTKSKMETSVNELKIEDCVGSDDSIDGFL